MITATNLHMDSIPFPQVSDVYDVVLDKVCRMDNMPMNWYDDLCNVAHKMIYDTLAEIDGTRKNRIERRNHEIFGYFADDRKTFNSEWNTYMAENWDNFEPCC